MKKLLFAISLLCFSLVNSIHSSALPVNAESYHITGDINNDEQFNVSDIVLLQKFLLSEPDTRLENWQAADFCKDGELNIFDFALAKKELLSPKNSETIESPACKAAAFACLDDKEIIYSNHIHEHISPASLTKLLTASVALHYLSPETIITVGSEQKLVKAGSSLCLIRAGHKLKLYDLLTGMLMASGNDAAYTVAVSVARAVKTDTEMNDAQAVAYFAELMNDYASSLGMENSHFVNPDGWDDAEQYTTVSDLLNLADYAFSVPEIRTITSTYQKYVVFASGENITWTSSNALLNPDGAYYCPDAVGMKTGTTKNAGNCLIAAFTRNEKTYLSIVVGCPSNAERYTLTLKLLSAFTE